MTDEDELTPEEKMAFQRLPREADPSRILEERIVRSLRDQGVLGSTREADGAGTGLGRTRPGGQWLRPWMVGAAVAASLVLFASGIFLGQRLGSQSAAQAFLAVREQDAGQLALTIQEAGSAYVSALAALGELRAGELRDDLGAQPGPGGNPLFSASEMEQGREVALGALYGAAYELARMSPDDADVLRVLQILEDRQAREEGYGGVPRNVVWF
ncbi:MAG: hypothetical protein PVJ04_07845 [Gemmatimonadota bacterium]|jgi:hypothetical protein